MNDLRFAFRSVPGTTFGLGRGRVGGEVVGVVRNTRDFGLEADSRPMSFLAHQQVPVGFMSVVLRTAGEPEALSRAVSAQVAALDPEVPAFDVRTMDERMVGAVAALACYFPARRAARVDPMVALRYE